MSERIEGGTEIPRNQGFQVEKPSEVSVSHKSESTQYVDWTQQAPQTGRQKTVPGADNPRLAQVNVAEIEVGEALLQKLKSVDAARRLIDGYAAEGIEQLERAGRYQEAATLREARKLIHLPVSKVKPSTTQGSEQKSLDSPLTRQEDSEEDTSLTSVGVANLENEMLEASNFAITMEARLAYVFALAENMRQNIVLSREQLTVAFQSMLAKRQSIIKGGELRKEQTLAKMWLEVTSTALSLGLTGFSALDPNTQRAKTWEMLNTSVGRAADVAKSAIDAPYHLDLSKEESYQTLYGHLQNQAVTAQQRADQTAEQQSKEYIEMLDAWVRGTKGRTDAYNRP